MIYELRDYTLRPGDVPHYLDLFERKGLPRLSRFAELIAYWRIESGGGLNRILHIWRYASRLERMSKRGELYKDKAWLEEFLPHGIAMLLSQESYLLSTFEFTPDPMTLRAPSGTSAPRLFELETYELPAAEMSVFSGLLRSYLEIRRRRYAPAVAFHSQTGSVGTVRVVTAYDDENNREVRTNMFNSDHEGCTQQAALIHSVKSVRRELLYGASFSPLR